MIQEGVYLSDTIYALSTTPGRSGVAVFRLSGPQATQALSALTAKALPKARQVAFRELRDPRTATLIDTALVFRFDGPASFTGEDVVEIQCHGSLAVIDKLNQQFSQIQGLRPAQPGEFTRRAYDNGKMDLLEAEGLGDLIHAETEAQRRQAMGLASGDLSATYLKWRQDLINLLAYQEALIDFGEEDLPDDVEQQRRVRLQTIHDAIKKDIEGSKLKQAIREGISVVLVGLPNAGKSSLLNALSGRDAAIVTDIEGTTRDLIEVDLDLDGFPLVLTDTAGMRESSDQVERIGVERAKRAAETADILIQLTDLSSVSRETFLEEANPHIRVGTKRDLAPNKQDDSFDVCVSLTTGEGLDAFQDCLLKVVKQKFAGFIEAPSHTRERHRAELELVNDSLARARAEDLPELAAESIRIAVAAIDRLVGRSDVEDVLDVIFSDFCIGK